MGRRERGPWGLWVSRPDIAARAKELWADAHNYRYSDIGKMLGEQFKVPPMSVGTMARFYMDNGLNRRLAEKLKRPVLKRKPVKGQDAKANQRARKLRKARATRNKSAEPKPEPSRVKLDVAHHEATEIGVNPTLAFDAALWPRNASMVELERLKDGLCRWPFELPNGAHVYCGCQAMVLSYCAQHAATAYRHAPTVERASVGGSRGGDEQAGDADGDDGAHDSPGITEADGESLDLLDDDANEDGAGVVGIENG